MPIPTQHDYDITAVETLAAVIVGSLRTVARAADQDRPKMRQRLRQNLQKFVDLAMEMADERV